MRNLILLFILLLHNPAFAEDSTTLVDKALITKLIPSHVIIDPGLYEVISTTTGNIVYIYKDKNGHLEMDVVNIDNKEK